MGQMLELGQPKLAERVSQAWETVSQQGLGGGPPRTRWERVALLGVTLALLAIAAPLNVALYDMNVAVGLVLAAAHAGSVLLTYVYPWRGLLLSVLCIVVIAWMVDPASLLPRPFTVVGLITQLAVMVVAGLRSPWYVASVGWVVMVVAAFFANSHFGLRQVDPGPVTNMVVFTSISFGLLVISILAQQWQLIRKQLRVERNVSAAEAARRELIEERAGIARELHDVVAHGMSLVTVQATTARYRYPGLDERIIAEFDEIAGHSRRAMAEMRQMLGVLRSEGADRETMPQPGIDELPALIGSIRQAGIDIEFIVPAELEAGPVHGLIIYRAVQEALSNVVRHAPGSQAVVEIETTSSSITLMVENGPATVTAAVSRGGHGLIGMRERVQAVGGKLDYGPIAGGGFRVVSSLPRIEEPTPNKRTKTGRTK